MSDINLVISYKNGNLDVVSKDAEKKLSKAGKESGKGFSKNFSKGFPSVLSGVKNIGLAIGAIGAVTVFKSISSAIQQEEAVNNLAGALRASGDFSKEALKDLEDYATGLQKVTKIGDEAVLEQLALAKGFGATNEQAKKIVSAAADLSVGLGIDLNAAVRNVSKTLGGYAGELGEVLPGLANFTKEQLKSGQAIDLIAGKFAGLAENQTNTFAGAFEQTTNTIGDFLESLGEIVTKNPLIIRALKGTTQIFSDLIDRVKDFGASFDIFDDLITPLLNVNDALIKYVAAPLEFVANIGNTVFQGLVTGTARVVEGFGFLGGKIAELLSAFGINNGITDGLKTFAETSGQVADEAQNNFNTALNTVADFPLSASLQSKNEDLRTFFQEQREIIAAESQATDEVVNQAATKVVESNQAVSASLLDVFRGLSVGIDNTKKTAIATAKQTAAIFKGSFAKGISGGIQNITNSLIAGEDVFANFGKFLFGLFGDLAIQLGTFWIAQGIAVQAAQSVSGTGAIVAGAALVAVGTLLKSFSGGGASSSAAGGSGGSASSPAFSPAEDTIEQGLTSEAGPVQQGTVVNLTVEGNSFGNEAFARQVAESIDEEGSKQGIVFNNFQTV